MNTSELFQLGRSEPESRTGRVRRAVADNWFSYALILPTLLFLLFVLWIPFVRGVWMSFYNWPLVGEHTWVGVKNYTYLFSWDVFYTSLVATLLYSTTTLVQLVVAVVAALLVVRLKRFKSTVNGLLLVPYTMPPVITGTLWLYLLDPDFGPFFQYLQKFGLIEHAIYWSTKGSWSMLVVTLVSAWIFWPFMFLIIVASLENIPDEYYETASVYGANRVQTFLRVTLPQLKSAILVAFSIRMIWNLTKVSQILQMTQGGPGYKTSVLAVLLYRLSFGRNNLGLGYTVGIILLLISLAFVGLFIREFHRQSKGVGQ